MDITYFDNELEKICNDFRYSQKVLGSDGVHKLKQRLADILAAESVTDLIAGHPHPLKGNLYGSFAVSLDRGNRLVFKPNHEEVPYNQDKAIDWSKVTKIKITYIGNYHE